MRKPDFVIGGEDNPYLRRWWVIPRNKLFNIYLHQMLRDDDDRALHDHPWVNCSIVLKGGYFEHMPADDADPAGPTRQKWRGVGAVVFRRPKAAHRLSLWQGNPSWSLFITGPRIRSWGFWCPKGWRDWKVFTNTDDGGATVGRGCAD
jgi:hypothetical protein